MSTSSLRRAAQALILALTAIAAGSVHAAERLAPKHLLNDPALLKDLFAEHIPGQAEVVEARIGDNGATIAIVASDDPHSTENWEASPREPIKKNDNLRSSFSLPCPRLHMSFAQLDFAGAARAFDQATAIAQANGYIGGGSVSLNVVESCERLVWDVEMYDEDNPENRARIKWRLDGSAPVARDGNHRPIPFAKLLAGAKRSPKPAEPEAPPPPKRDFLNTGISAELAQVEQRTGAPLQLLGIAIDSNMVRIEAFEPGSRNKKKRDWLFDWGKGLRETPELNEVQDYIDCSRPFTSADFALDRLPELIAGAGAAVPPMAATAHVTGVSVGRSSLDCHKPPRIEITIEDERGFGDVIYDARGNLIEAKVR